MIRSGGWTDRVGKRYSALTPAARITVAHFSV